MADLSDAYWAGAAEGRLVLQKCGDCGRIRHYPQMLCSTCHSFAVEHVTASGHGAVHSWTVSHHAFTSDVRDQVPYTLVTVDMEEGVRVLGRLADNAPLRIGLPVHLGFETRADERPIPVFTAATRVRQEEQPQ
ncbi:Zn-ribbon domain-containing OB-fold protein (plasmid) [Rhodococcus sp. ZPP]|uniref:Zn-ribbon domain-containing OB-fold protein n=1 Tax=Rhodococcus sp. ZPP TaxID=2749906 RepID=UPI001AD86D1E|nr:Zn-ribbon domain-containing OB-fold protein [Rhodococcus sp. ZPP]QTJ70514.1 Zn-ribbon domain-containing OB-fold protein [Rhodococcus sp. ZPP]